MCFMVETINPIGFRGTDHSIMEEVLIGIGGWNGRLMSWKQISLTGTARIKEWALRKTRNLLSSGAIGYILQDKQGLFQK